MCVATVKAMQNVWAEYASRLTYQKSCLFFKDRNDVVTQKCVVLVAVGERHEGLQKT